MIETQARTADDRAEQEDGGCEKEGRLNFIVRHYHCAPRKLQTEVRLKTHHKSKVIRSYIGTGRITCAQCAASLLHRSYELKRLSTTAERRR